jgi:hypothetical protein
MANDALGCTAEKRVRRPAAAERGHEDEVEIAVSGSRHYDGAASAPLPVFSLTATDWRTRFTQL